MELELVLVSTASSFPSPLKSATATAHPPLKLLEKLGMAYRAGGERPAAAIARPNLNAVTAGADDEVGPVVTIQIANRDRTDTKKRHPMVRGGRENGDAVGIIHTRVDQDTDEGIVGKIDPHDR